MDGQPGSGDDFGAGVGTNRTKLNHSVLSPTKTREIPDNDGSVRLGIGPRLLTRPRSEAALGYLSRLSRLEEELAESLPVGCVDNRNRASTSSGDHFAVRLNSLLDSDTNNDAASSGESPETVQSEDGEE